ncbi:MAG: GAF domain-containing protein [Anaerolineales bacterium]|nr:GAF domain-containing protein [Anaerolineales bacterium]
MPEQLSLQLEREKRLLSETLTEIALALTSHTRHKEVLDEILTQAKRLVPYQTAHILLLENDSLRIAHWQGYENTGSEQHISTLVQPLANFPFDQEVIQSKTARVLSDTHQEPSWIVTPETKWVRSHLVLPIYLHNQVLGVLRLDSNQPGQFTLKDAENLQPLANIAAIALKNAQLYEQFRRELKERRRTEAALRISEEFGQTILNSLSAQIAVLNHKGEIIHVNEAWSTYARKNGGNPITQQGQGLNYLDVCRTAIAAGYPGAQDVFDGLQQVLSNADSSFDYEYPCDSPTEKQWFLLRALPLKSKDGGLVVAHINFTQIKQLESNIKHIHQLGQELTLLRDKETIIWRVLETASNVLKVDAIACGLIDLVKQEIRFPCRLVDDLPESINLRLSLQDQQSIIAKVARDGQPINIADTRQIAHYTPIGWAGRSKLCVPLKVGERVIGILDIESAKPDYFTPDNTQIVQILADQTAVALENAQLHLNAQRYVKELGALYRAGQTITSNLDLSLVLNQIIVEVTNLFEARMACLLLLDSLGNDLIFAAIAPTPADTLVGSRIPLADGIANWVIKEKEPIVVDDVKNDPRFDGYLDSITGLTTHSLLAIPLTVEDSPIGLIQVIDKAGGAFNQQDLELLEALTSSAVIAIENARLFEQSEYRAKQLSVLHQVDRAITANLHINEVYDAFAQNIAQLFPYDRLSIALVEENSLRITHAIGYAKNELPTSATLSLHNSAIGWVVLNQKPLIRANIADGPHFITDKMLLAAGLKSAMSIPLQIKGQTIGTWNLSSKYKNAYQQDHLPIAQSLADQLAIAIENARLYQTEREQHLRLQHSQERLVQVEKMAALGRLVASIAHEINNPLQSVQSCLTLMREDLNDVLRQRELESIADIAEEEIERISSLVSRLREFYRPVSPAQNDRPEPLISLDGFYRLDNGNSGPVDLHVILEAVLKLVHKKLEDHNLTVKCEWHKELPPIQANQDYLKQIFLNLILNSLDASPPSGSSLIIRTGPDCIVTETGPSVPAVRIEFSDTGHGIPPEIQSRLFEPLFTTKDHGSGLGLFTTYKVIKAHNGQITVNSKVGNGTTFTILLPVQRLTLIHPDN